MLTLGVAGLVRWLILGLTLPGFEYEKKPPVKGAALVIGYGNELRGDDGVGYHVARRLADDPRIEAAAARVLARRQLTPELALDLSRAGMVVFVDASTLLAPGEVSSRRVEAVTGPRSGTSHHQTPEELLAFAAELYGAAPSAVAISIGVQSLEMAEGLSPAVESAMETAAEEVVRIVTDRAGTPGQPDA
jgi:hydrogenase maturation protease